MLVCGISLITIPSYRDDLDIENTDDSSFIVHEYVHALQYAHIEEPFKDCYAVFRAESQAYKIQSAFLRKNGSNRFVGVVLKFMSCKNDDEMTYRAAKKQ